ncbi:hypothetical protein QBC40DRAFT_210167 [Triangularia verruculosa]|uniref:Uncharacterized protein n=1 Tax=Triangularia verruculosa TaxID=2587418 RepID=A0AAN7AP62_9PEZI|nr:hypothetical protein QBC40DRAFT_210167 [Triangularia verruculosa]
MSRQSRTPSPPPLMVTHVDERLEGTDRVSAATWTREIMWDDPYPPTDEQLEAYGRQSYDWLDSKYGSRAFIGGSRSRGSLLVATMYIPFGLDGGVIYQSTIPRGVFRQEISQYGSTYAVNWWFAASSFVTVTNPTTRQREVRSNRDGPHPDHIHAEDVLYYLVERNYRDRFIRGGKFFSRDGPIRIIVYGYRPGYDYRPREQQRRDVPYVGVQELCAPGHQKNACCQDICGRLGCTWIKPQILRVATSSTSAGGGGGGGSSRPAPGGDSSRRSGPSNGRPAPQGGGGYTDGYTNTSSTRPSYSGGGGGGGGGMTELTMGLSGLSVKSSRRDEPKVRSDARHSSRKEEIRSYSRRDDVYRDDSRSSTRRSDPYRDDERSRRTTEAAYRDERDRYGEVRRVVRGEAYR